MDIDKLIHSFQINQRSMSFGSLMDIDKLILVAGWQLRRVVLVL